MVEAGEDVQAVLGPIIKARNLGHLVPSRALEHPDPKQALKVGGCDYRAFFCLGSQFEPLRSVQTLEHPDPKQAL